MKQVRTLCWVIHAKCCSQRWSLTLCWVLLIRAKPYAVPSVIKPRGKKVFESLVTWTLCSFVNINIIWQKIHYTNLLNHVIIFQVDAGYLQVFQGKNPRNISPIDFNRPKNFNGLEAKLYYSNTQKQNGEFFSNFTNLFLLLLSTICPIIYFIWSSDYSNLKGPFALDYLLLCC